jgi:hypothetical protein
LVTKLNAHFVLEEPWPKVQRKFSFSHNLLAKAKPAAQRVYRVTGFRQRDWQIETLENGMVVITQKS